MRSARAQRLLGGLSVGYVQTSVAVVVGLWLTPYLLRQLGVHDYGLWLLGAQVIFYLGLLDLGVVALVPREVAGVSGHVEQERAASVQAVVGRTVRLVLWQLPAVAVAALVVMWVLPAEWHTLRGPLGCVVLVFVLAFPFRVCIAILQGLQDLAWVGWIQTCSWAVGTVVTLLGVFAGIGLYSLALGWAITQTLSATLALIRLRRSFPGVIPRSLPSVTLASAREQLGRGVWVSVGQVAQVLLSGTDLVVIGKMMGPAAVVPYVCTGKLITLLGNQPQMFMQLALPALSELRSSAPRHRLFEVSRAMTQVMLLASGAIVAIVLASNAPFVTWWVGEGQFGGMTLTALLLVGMLLRHLNVTAVYALFCFGNERRLAVTAIAEGLVSLSSMFLLAPALGLAGVALGSIVGTVAVSLPNNLRALAREEGSTPMALVRPLKPWASRLAFVLGVAWSASLWAVGGVVGLVMIAGFAGLGYLLIMIPILRTPPLSHMLLASVRPLLAMMPGMARIVAQPTQSV